jgi:hypothetical protein
VQEVLSYKWRFCASGMFVDTPSTTTTRARGTIDRCATLTVYAASLVTLLRVSGLGICSVLCTNMQICLVSTRYAID